jgi:hypothetical protein
MLGIPLSRHHATALQLDFGDHLHAALLFVVSNVLIFWLFARPKASSQQIFLAEVIPVEEILTPFRQDEP